MPIDLQFAVFVRLEVGEYPVLVKYLDTEDDADRYCDIVREVLYLVGIDFVNAWVEEYL